MDRVETLYRLAVETAEIREGGPRTAAAEQLFRRALECDPGHVPSALGLGTLLLEDGRPEEALPVLRAGLERHGVRGDVGDRGGADFTYALTVAIGRALHRLGRHAEALEVRLGALKVRPTVSGHVDVASTLLALGRHADVVRVLEPLEGLARSAGDLDLPTCLGRAFMALGDAPRARLLLRDVLDRDATHAEARRALEALDRSADMPPVGPPPRPEVSTEATTCRVVGSLADEKVRHMGRFAWELVGRTDVTNLAPEPTEAFLFGDLATRVVPRSYGVRLEFRRSLDLPEIRRLRELEQRYFDLGVGQTLTAVTMGTVMPGCMLLVGVGVGAFLLLRFHGGAHGGAPWWAVVGASLCLFAGGVLLVMSVQVRRFLKLTERRLLDQRAAVGREADRILGRAVWP